MKNDYVTELVEPTPNDTPKLADILAQAFMTDPVFSWIFRQDNRRRRALKDYFTTYVLGNAFEEGEVLATKNFEGCAVWFPPGKGFMDASPEAMKSLLPEILNWAKKDRVDRVLEAMRLLTENRPSWPHYYLEYLGVAPKYQGRGLGTLLLRAKLELIDAEGARVYLESTNDRNLPLYFRQGFKAVKREAFMNSGPVYTFMSRDPTLRIP